GNCVFSFRRFVVTQADPDFRKELPQWRRDTCFSALRVRALHSPSGLNADECSCVSRSQGNLAVGQVNKLELLPITDGCAVRLALTPPALFGAQEVPVRSLEAHRGITVADQGPGLPLAHLGP